MMDELIAITSVLLAAGILVYVAWSVVKSMK